MTRREGLTDEVVRLLRWIDENVCTQSAWLTNGKPARGGPEKWNQHLCAGPTGSIIVSDKAWFAARDYFEPNAPDCRPSQYRLTTTGRAALASLKGGPSL